MMFYFTDEWAKGDQPYKKAEIYKNSEKKGRKICH